MSKRASFRSAIAVALVLLASLSFAEVGKNTAVLNPNLASEAELTALDGVDASTAQAIIDGRPFLDITELEELLAGRLSDEVRTELYQAVFVPLDLNRASNESILLVPGVGRRMAHEFDEYRPYEGMARFRREIGKYVDEDEVARLEQYVFVPINLNTASEEDIKTIPGVGKRMTHEFLEYRPYRSLEQFRREIGKYVDEDELARLERFVTLD